MILDATCGGKMMYKGLDKQFPPTTLLFLDRRLGHFTFPQSAQYKNPAFTVEPTVVADMKQLPFTDNLFKLIIFDPPHYKMGVNSIFRIKYDSWDKHEFILTLHYINKEFHRILEPGGVLLAKILDIQHRAKTTERELTNFTLLLKIRQHSPDSGISNPSKHRTYWMTFISTGT